MAQNTNRQIKIPSAGHSLRPLNEAD